MSGDSNENSSDRLPEIRPISAPMEVPVFSVVIYVSHIDHNVKARVANLPDLLFTASSEPMVLKQAITEVKRRLASWHETGEKIPWIEPIPEPTADEQQRLVPVHL